jgi:endoglucanase Acf2
MRIRSNAAIRLGMPFKGSLGSVAHAWLACSLIAAQGAVAQVKVGLGSYATSASGAIPGGAPRITSDFAQKTISATWWATLISGDHSGEMYAHPACYRAVAHGLEVGYPGAPLPSGDGFHSPYTVGLTVGMDGLNTAQTQVAAYSHFSVTARWSGSGRTLEATIAHGLPFSYYKVTGGEATVAADGTIYYNKDGTLGITVDGKSYGVFAPTGAVWSGSGTLKSNLAGKDYLSVAVLPDDRVETLLFFRKYAFAHVKKTVVTWQYLEKSARLISTFAVQTETKEGAETGTVFALMRHHWKETITPLTAYAYASARGQMKVAAGPSFSTLMRFNGILPAMPDVGRDPDVLKAHISGQDSGSGEGDTYHAGKQLGKLSVLVQLAEFAGNAAKRDEYLSAIKSRLQEWFTAGGRQQLYYHQPWGALIGYPASFGSDARLSDHHFHYSYQLQAAAVIAQWDKEWAKKGNWGGMVEMLIRDVNSWDEADPLFGRFRYFDPYEGHGWADGTGFEARGNNQESSSESMNFNAALIQWGINTGNATLRDMGIFMYLNEARAIEQYWWDVDGEVFPPGYDREAVGLVWGNGGAYATWFSGAASEIHGINILPITPGHLYLGRNPDHVERNYAEGAKGGWQDLFLQYLAFADADRAVAAYGSGVDPEAGSSRAYAYHHLQSLKAAGRLQTQIGADIPSFAVFDKSGVRSYTAFNPGASTIIVAFTDGFRLEVPAGRQVTRTGEARHLSLLRRERAGRSPRMGVWMGGGPRSPDPGSRFYDLSGRALPRGVVPAPGAGILLPASP